MFEKKNKEKLWLTWLETFLWGGLWGLEQLSLSMLRLFRPENTIIYGK
jgi:hypothetical protein